MVAFGCLTALLGFVAACGDDSGAIPNPNPQPTAGTITGSVKDSTGAPIVGAQVGTSPASTIALSDGSGNFTINNVPAGSVTVVASKEGFNSDFEQVMVVSNQTVRADLVLSGGGGGGGPTTGTVSGIVTRRDGGPVAGVTVNLVQGGDCSSTPVATATTDAGGGFLVEGLAPGTYLACVTTVIGGQSFSGRAGFVVNAGALATVSISVGRETNQTTEPNIGGTPIELDANGNFEGAIQFVDWDADGTANVDCNIIFTQHLWVVQVTDSAGTPVSGARVEWSLNQGPGIVFPVQGPDPIRGSTGVIVDSDDPFLDPVQAEAAKAVAGGVSPQFVVDATHAVTYTNDTDQGIDFNGQTVTVAAGSTWIIVTSPQEGFTDVVAFSPDLARSSECSTDELGNSTCPDKAFAVKRWVNWRIQVAELLPQDTTGGVTAGSLGAAIVSDGDTLSNRLDRTPSFGNQGLDCAGRPNGSICDLENNAFIGVVLSRLRLDSPFTFTSGTVDFAITDDSPDSDVLDIDSDEDPGGPIFAGGDLSADDDEGGTSANGTPLDELATAPFDMDAEVSFECEVDPNFQDECLDVDVVNNATNSQGQTLQDMGFTITTGVTEQAAVAITVALDQTIFFATATDTVPGGFVFSPDMQALINGTADNTGSYSILIRDEFGEVCDQILIGKRWITSVLRIFKQGPTLVENGTQFTYTVTAVNDGDTRSTNVIVADTLPILDVFTAGDRLGDQAFQYVTDAPTFDPDGIRYYIDNGDNEGGTTTDVCLQAPSTNFPAAFVTPESTALCNGNFVNFPTIADARAAAQAASAAGNQVVIVEYFDVDILARTDPGGDIEAEDSFEITLQAFQSVNDFRVGGPGGPLPQEFLDPNGTWCNIATVTSAENDFAADSVCTRVVEALLEVRKTVSDAIVPAGDQTTFEVAIGNNGSADLTNVTVSDTLDPSFTALGDSVNNPGLVMVENLCAGCTFVVDTLATGATQIVFTVPVVPSTDLNNNGVLDDDEGFIVANIVVRTPLQEGQFCNRVTATDDVGRTDTDIACVVTQVEIEFDIVNNDGLLVNGAFTDVETFSVGDTVAYQTSITNRSNVSATNVSVLWEIAPISHILQLEPIDTANGFDLADPPEITCSTTTDTCSVTVATLAPGATIALNYRAIAQFQGNDVNRITLNANELSNSVVNEEPTTVNP